MNSESPKESPPDNGNSVTHAFDHTLGSGRICTAAPIIICPVCVFDDSNIVAEVAVPQAAKRALDVSRVYRITQCAICAVVFDHQLLAKGMS
jgi:hypothetical protein